METLINLGKAYVGESQARNRYSFYAKIAKNEGFEQIAEIFLLTAENEKEHAKTVFRFINELNERTGKPLDFECEVPTVFGNTAANLQAAIDGESYENEKMYPEFAEVAEKEGFSKIAARLRAIAVAEGHHKERFKKLLDEIKTDSLFKKKEKVWWVCRECGYLHFGETPPEKCPSCGHEKKFFERKCEVY